MSYEYGKDKELDHIRASYNLSKVVKGMVGRKKKRKGMLSY